MGLTVQVGQLDDVVVVSCCGRIVFGEETTELCRSVRALLPTNPQIVLNLRGVDYVDSGGLGALVGLVLSARGAGGDVKLCDVVLRVRDVLDVTHLGSVIQVLPTREDAIAAFRGGTVAA